MKTKIVSILLLLLSPSAFSQEKSGSWGVSIDARLSPWWYRYDVPVFISGTYSTPKNSLLLGYGTVPIHYNLYHKNSLLFQHRFIPYPSEKRLRFFVTEMIEFNYSKYHEEYEKIAYNGAEFYSEVYRTEDNKETYVNLQVGLGARIKIIDNLFVNYCSYFGYGYFRSSRISQNTGQNPLLDESRFWEYDIGLSAGVTYVFKNKE